MGPALHGLESVTAGPGGEGSSSTTLSRGEAGATEEHAHEQGDGEPREHAEQEPAEHEHAEHGEHEAAESGEAEHPPVFIQVHRPDGTPVACSDV